MKVDEHGWLEGVEHIPSPNCDDRPTPEIFLLVIHNISLPPDEFGGDGVRQLFTNTLDTNAHPYYQTLAGLNVSSHFFIRRDGHIIQFVSCLQRAWHAGASCWQNRQRCNDFSIGIELEGSDTVPFTDAQYVALQDLTPALRFFSRAQYAALQDLTPPTFAIAGHSDIAPQRKTDPGPFFDWLRYLTKLADE
ncbi:MAG: 1,6-anhydro-N-acetylmuramyl-L-alanine amidase AmpD [Gallionella sp.]